MLSIIETANTEFKREYLYKMSFDPTFTLRIRQILRQHNASFVTAFNDFLDIDYLNKDAVFPDRIAEVETMFWKGRTVRFAKYSDSSGESDFIFFDDEKNISESILTVLYNDSTFLQDSNSFIGDISIEEFDVDKQSVTREAVLVDCHITGIKHGTRKKESSDISYITVHITWDLSKVFNYWWKK